MTLGFIKKWPEKMGDIAGHSTFFDSKIWSGLIQHYPYSPEEYGFHGKGCGRLAPKIHSIREDYKDRWKKGNKIHMVTGNRTPNRFQFAPIVSCESVQKIIIVWGDDEYLEGNVLIGIDGSRNYYEAHFDKGKLISCDPFIKDLARNDGFPSVIAFFRWFHKDFSGKIIHWTNHKYTQ